MRSATAQRVADRLAGNFDQLAHDAHAVRDRSAVSIGAPILFGQQEFIRQVAHAGIDINDVEARALCLACGFCLPTQQIRDVGCDP